MAKKGRPRALDQAKKDIAIKLAIHGHTIVQIADIIGVSHQTIYEEMDYDAHFADALDEGRAFADELVEKALFQKAVGFACKETKTFYDKDLGKVVEHDTIKNHAPDVTAQKFWLTNRKPGHWRDRREFDLRELSDLGDNELENLVKQILDKREGANGSSSTKEAKPDGKKSS